MTDFLLAGSLTQRVTIQKVTLADDGQGGKTKTWSTRRSNVPAKVEGLSGREAIFAQQLSAVLTTTVTMRYRSDVSVTDRIVWKGKTLQIESLRDPAGQGMRLVALCSEVQS